MKTYKLKTQFKSYSIGISKLSGVNMWTSGFKDKDCNHWCTNNGVSETIASTVNWLQQTPANDALVERCATIELNGDATKSGLKYADCSLENQFICEVVQTTFFHFKN